MFISRTGLNDHSSAMGRIFVFGIAACVCMPSPASAKASLPPGYSAKSCNHKGRKASEKAKTADRAPVIRNSRRYILM